MDSFLYSINATVPIFLVMIVGWLIKQIGVIDDHLQMWLINMYLSGTPVIVIQDRKSSRF